MAAKLMRASRVNSGQAHFQCNWSRQNLQAWLASDIRLDGKEGVLVLVNVDQVVITSITVDNFELQYDDLQRVLHIGEDDDSGLATFADDLFQLRRPKGFECVA